jgi:hypothetical protein
MTFAVNTLLDTKKFLYNEPPKGVSVDAGIIEQLTQNAFKQICDYKDRFFASRISTLLDELIEDDIANVTSTEEVNISTSALTEVNKVLRFLPRDIPLPSLVKENSGAIALEWYKNPRNIFIASFNGTKTIEYAAIFGSRSELHGKIEFRNKIPDQLIAQIKLFQDQ